jgi:hypothetical protein
MEVELHNALAVRRAPGRMAAPPSQDADAQAGAVLDVNVEDAFALDRAQAGHTAGIQVPLQSLESSVPAAARSCRAQVQRMSAS